MIVTWLGEQITDKGYGNGVSMIIFAGIVASIPEMIQGIYVDYFVNVPSSRINFIYHFRNHFDYYCLLIVYFTTYVQQAEYKIPIQYTKIAQGAPSSSYLPLKVNPAGVIPVIFASSITAAPAAILQFLSATGHDWVLGKNSTRNAGNNITNWYCHVCSVDYSLYILLYICTD